MGSFINRKKTKINLKTSLKKEVEESPPRVKQLLGFVVISTNAIILFAFMAGWSLMNSVEVVPAFQVFPLTWETILTKTMEICILHAKEKMHYLKKRGFDLLEASEYCEVDVDEVRKIWGTIPTPPPPFQG